MRPQGWSGQVVTVVVAFALATAVLVPAWAVDRAAIVAEARSLAERIADPGQRALALADVAMALAPANKTDSDALFGSALQAAVAADEPLQQVIAQRGVGIRWAAVLPAQGKATLLAAAQEASKLKYVSEKALALREVARALAPLDKGEAAKVFADAKAAAEKIDANVLRAAALRELALATESAFPDLAGQCLEGAVTALKGAPTDPGLPLAQGELAATMARFDVERGCRMAEELKDEEIRRSAWLQIASHLAERSPDGALAALRRMKDPQAQVLALAAVAARLDATRDTVAAMLAEQALAKATQLETDDRERATAWCAQALALTDVARAVDLAAKLTNTEVRDEALVAIAGVQAGTDPPGALKTTDRIGDVAQREAAVGRVVPLLAKRDPDSALAQARRILARRARVSALLAIAAVVSAPSEPVTDRPK